MFTFRYIKIKELLIAQKLEKGHSVERIADSVGIEVEKVEDVKESLES